MRKSRAAAESIVAATGIRKGYAIDYGCGEGRLTFALAKRTELTVIGVTADADEAARARAALRRAGIYGTRVIIHHRRLAKLGHTDRMFNLAVSSELLHHGKLPGDRAELLRVLRPSGGVLVLGGLPQSGLGQAHHRLTPCSGNHNRGERRVAPSQAQAARWRGQMDPHLRHRRADRQQRRQDRQR